MFTENELLIKKTLESQILQSLQLMESLTGKRINLLLVAKDGKLSNAIIDLME